MGCRLMAGLMVLSHRIFVRVEATQQLVPVCPYGIVGTDANSTGARLQGEGYFHS